MPGRDEQAAGLVGLVRAREQVDEFARALLPGGEPVFGTVSLQLPDLEGAAELAFIRTASWLYVHYFEAGRVGVRFLVDRNRPITDEGVPDHHRLVQALRTWSQHNLDPGSKRDLGIEQRCRSWFLDTCRTRIPRDEAHWSILLDALITEAASFMRRLVDLIAEIESDPGCQEICEQWEQRLRREWPAFRYHELISIVAADMGRDSIDPATLYNRHGATWREALTLVSDDCDFHLETRRQIELTLLSETASALPITGADLMDHFDIPPGPEIGRLLALARTLYEEAPCKRDELLGRLAQRQIPDS